jgi:hypothetical protein
MITRTIATTVLDAWHHLTTRDWPISARTPLGRWLVGVSVDPRVGGLGVFYAGGCLAVVVGVGAVHIERGQQ